MDHVILCLSQPSLSAASAHALLAAAATAAAQAGVICPVSAVRLEGEGQSLPDALDAARVAGARQTLVQPLGLPMAANILAWLPGAVAHWQAQAQAQAGPGLEVTLGQPPAPEAVLPALVTAALASARLLAEAAPSSLGKPGWQYLPDHDTHILVCTGPRCAFRGAGTLAQRLKVLLTASGLRNAA